MNIKKLTYILIFVQFTVSAYSNNPADSIQADTTGLLEFTSLNMLSVNQIAFVNWASGGESSLSAKVSTEYDLTYKHKRFTYEHLGKIAFGLVGYVDKRVEKTDDLFDFLWSANHETVKNLHLTGMLTFKSQFANGYKYPDDSTLISTFMAPGYINVSM